MDAYRLPVPDTLNQYILLPLSFGLAIKYIFEKEINRKLLFVLSLLLIFMALIHLTQYVYFLIIMIVFMVIYALSQFRSQDYKIITTKTLWTIVTSVLIILPFILFFQFKDHLITKYLNSFAIASEQKIFSGNFSNFNLYVKISFLSLPILWLFVKKYRKFIFLFAVGLTVSLVYSHTIGFVQYWLIKMFGFIFISRLLANTCWSWVAWAIIFGFMLLVIDRIILRINSVSKLGRYFIESLIAVLTLVFFWVDRQYNLALRIYYWFFSDEKMNWLNKYYLLLLLLSVIIVGLILIWQNYNQKLNDYFQFEDYKFKITTFCLTVMFVVIFISPAGYFPHIFIKNPDTKEHFFEPIRDMTPLVVSPRSLGDPATLEYIEKNIPSKSVFDTNAGYYLLPMMVDQYVSSYQHLRPSDYKELYDSNLAIESRLLTVVNKKIEYILITHSKEQTKPAFEKYPEYFTNIFETKNSVIYQVDRERARKDFIRSQNN